MSIEATMGVTNRRHSLALTRPNLPRYLPRRRVTGATGLGQQAT